MFARDGIWFESHLGHVFPCQGPFWASDVYTPCPPGRYDGVAVSVFVDGHYLWAVPSVSVSGGFVHARLFSLDWLAAT